MDKTQATFTVVVNALASVKTLDVENVNLETRLIADVGLESIDIIDFIFELEKSTQSEVNLIDLFQSANMKSERGYSDLKVKDVVDILMSAPA